VIYQGHFGNKMEYMPMVGTFLSSTSSFSPITILQDMYYFPFFRTEA
jgi:hypothetical protein